MSQHLAALTLDQETAPYVNLVKTDMPGDLYRYIAEHVWERIDREYANLEDPLEVEILVDQLIELKKEINQSDELHRLYLIEEIQALKKHELMGETGVAYWHRITDLKERRKIVKRKTLRWINTSNCLG